MSEANRSLVKNHLPVSGRLILLAHASAAQRRLIAVQLQATGHRVIEAGSQRAARDICARQRPDILICDWHLPDDGDTGINGDGLMLCRWFRSLGPVGAGHILMLTDGARKADIMRGLDAGADDFLPIPIAGADLLARIGMAERVLSMERNMGASIASLRRARDRLARTHAVMEHDLQQARALQRRLLRERSEIWGDIRLSLLLRPAGHIGGDMVGFFPITGQRIGVYAMDVSGHNFTSALLTARLAAQFSATGCDMQRSEKSLGDDLAPGQFVQNLNRQLLDDLRVESYYTMIYGDLDGRTGELRLVQAGHPHPLIQRNDGRIERIGQGGLPVGILRDAVYSQLHLVLEPGDRLLLMSDGITDCEDPTGVHFGEQGIRAFLNDHADLGGSPLLEALSWKLSDYGHGRRNDDISALLIERRSHTEAETT